MLQRQVSQESNTALPRNAGHIQTAIRLLCYAVYRARQLAWPFVAVWLLVLLVLLLTAVVAPELRQAQLQLLDGLVTCHILNSIPSFPALLFLPHGAPSC
jgi:hypothetical protein